MKLKLANAVYLYAALLFCCACDTHCISESSILWDAGVYEYRLLVTNNTPHMVELFVDDESLGIYCDGVQQLPVGNFEATTCSAIRAEFLDHAETVYLDDCDVESEMVCKANNLDGKICYNTTLVEKVEAILD